jgi:hypothetical protein
VKRRLSRPKAIGLGVCLVVAAAVPVAVARQGAASAPTVRVAPLSQQDRQVLSVSRPLIEMLPRAIAEVPQAASDASGHRVTPAQVTRLLARTPALAPLARAVAAPASVTGPVLAAYHAALDGGTLPDGDRLASALEALQTVEGDIDPAIRLVAAGRHGRLTAADADLASLLAHWSQIYGTVTLVEQSAAR